ncbi:phosphate acetyltransferase [Stieleria sp. TO1_6]|nr:phosphate acetyltransferase [Stieleria tagensis]
MAKNLYVAACEPDCGKSLVVLGLMQLVSSRVERPGFFRPIIRSGDRPDNDTELVLSRFSLDQSYETSFGVTSDEAISLTRERGVAELLKQILQKFKAIESKSDFVLCEGTDYTGITSSFEFDLNARIANELGTPVLNLISGHGKSTLKIRQTAEATRSALREQGCTIAATIANRVSAEAAPSMRDRFQADWTFEDPIFLVTEEPSLHAPTVAAVAKELNATPLRNSEGDSNRDILCVSVAAMQLPHFLDRVREGKLVIVPGDRSDILLGCLATVASENYPMIAGILLTGGIMPDDSVIRLIEGFRRPLIPIYLVTTDTYETVRNVMAVDSVISADNERKIQIALGVFESCIESKVLIDRIDVARSIAVTPDMFEYELIEQAKRERMRIVLPEGNDERVLRAAEILVRRGVAEIILLGAPDLIRNTIASLGLGLEQVEIIDPCDNPYLNEFSERYYQLRKHKGVTMERARDTIQELSFFGTMMVQQGIADGMVSGADHTTAQTIRPALQIIRTRPGCSIVSSVFLMCLKDRVLVYGDCAVNPNPEPQQLADIAISSAETAQAFGVEPIVAMLSYSTGLSGTGEDVETVKRATEIVRHLRPDLRVDGPIQYDAAVDPSVARTKMPDSDVAGRATVFIFPDLNTGNNTYKAVQRSAGAVAIGPILQGLNRPINDLSRGCTVTDIVNTVAITAIQAQQVETLK